MEKPGYKTTEFWLSLAAVLVGALLASGLLPADSVWIKVAGMAATALAAMGYTKGRIVAKGDALRAKVAGVVGPPDPT